jgi:hypothetical protein
MSFRCAWFVIGQAKMVTFGQDIGKSMKGRSLHPRQLGDAVA